jgi:formylglycine-generating enzyme required for sulfatase activity
MPCVLVVLLAVALLGVGGGCEGEEPVPAAGTEPAPAQRAEAERTGYPVERKGPLGMTFRLVPAGAFQMGSPEDEAGHDAEEVPHEVELLRPYYLQTTEVTNAMWRRFRPDHEGPDDLPVTHVSHADAVAFVAWLTERDPSFVYRLPTEAEWERACRAGTQTPFATGLAITAPQATLACEEGVPPAKSPDPVAAHPPNAWGFYDLHGNVAEWCHDRYGPYGGYDQGNPQGAANGDERVVRGGCYRDPPTRARCAARAHLPEASQSETVGFRVAHNLGYGRTDYGRYEVLVRTVDPTVEEGEDADRPGWPMYMISVAERLTDRVNRLPLVRWTPLKHESPITLHLPPGMYYVYCYRMEGDRKVRSTERKFKVPGTDEVLCPIPRKYQRHPQ